MISVYESLRLELSKCGTPYISLQNDPSISEYVYMLLIISMHFVHRSSNILELLDQKRRIKSPAVTFTTALFDLNLSAVSRVFYYLFSICDISSIDELTTHQLNRHAFPILHSHILLVINSPISRVLSDRCAPAGCK